MAQPRHIAGSPRKRRGVPRNHGAQQPSAVPGRAQLAEGRCRGGGFRQETYLSAFANLHRYAGTAALSTWLTRIALNEGEAGARVIPFPLTQSTMPVSRTRSSAPI